MEWRLAEAKNRFSEVVNRALTEGPQRILRRTDVVIVIAECEYARLKGKRMSFKQFLLEKTPNLEGLDMARDGFPMREVKL